MSLLRLAFWLALLVMLLPTDMAQQARFTNFANGAMQRMSTFCDRNGRTCNVAAEVWATFLKKAEFGIRLVGDLLGAGGGQRPDLPPPSRRRADTADPRGSLPPPDRYAPPWWRDPPGHGRY